MDNRPTQYQQLQYSFITHNITVAGEKSDAGGAF
jgi:hypothetical protein